MEAPAQRAVDVKTAAKLLGISRSFAYDLCVSGQLRAKKVGQRWIVPLASIDEFLTLPAPDAVVSS